MDNDIEVYFEGGAGGCVNYLESLIRSKHRLTIEKPVFLTGQENAILLKLDEVILAELDLALLGAEKAKSEILKANKDNTVRPIK